MGACATKLSGDLKLKGEPPLVVEDAPVAPPVAEGEKANKADGVPPAAETTDPADVSRRRSLSDLLKEDAEASDEEAGQEEVKVVTVDSVLATHDEAGAPPSVSEDAEAGARRSVSKDAEAGALAIVSKEAAEAAKAPQAVVEPSAAVKVVTVDSVVATDDEAGAQASLPIPKEEEAAEATQVAVEPSAVVVEQDATAEHLTDDHKTGQEPDGGAQAAAEEEKRVDPDSVQVATVVAAATVAALSAEGSEVAGGASA